jgi:predicted pyridoxine 5'-phosphate oxidase superfamily flavin-nucleotide-binding protein
MQDARGTRKLADRVLDVTLRTEFTEDDKLFIETRTMFFLATAGPDGQPECSYKGGGPGFVRVTGPSTLVFPDYDGNGTMRSLGNLTANPKLGMILIDFDDQKRLQINGRGKVLDDPMDFPGARGTVQVTADAIFPKCPRYIHKGGGRELSHFTPEVGKEEPTPDWKYWKEFNDVLPDGDPAAGKVGGAKT